jgi:16S rRNA G966 N2-methylase RsmD
MILFDDNSVDVILFDPPYSGRQVAECYKKLNKTVTMNDTNSGYFTKFK